MTSAERCSTPFGITEVGTGLGYPGLEPVRSAQRLSASQRSAPECGCRCCTCPVVLNAFRHHRGRHQSGIGVYHRPVRVLNAFRHHRGRHWAIRTRRAGAGPVLNAFRHHRGRHVISTDVVIPCFSCSTPFGITEVGTRVALPWPLTTLRVLNAFRHHRGRHDPAPRIGIAGDQSCSTPFGITEVGTGRIGHEVDRPDLRAQRLSASQRSAHRPRLRLTQGRRHVLNAFRHHRGRHAALVGGRARPPVGAQRLSASQRSALLPRAGPRRHPERAQRLSASQRSAHQLRSTGCRRPALCSTPFGITEVGTRVDVSQLARWLSAQRLSASQRSAPAGSSSTPLTVVECSTPFGITEVGTTTGRSASRRSSGVLNAFRHHRGRHDGASRARRPASQVLNAFRHHRGRHARSRRSRLAVHDRCSTPFGITEVGTVTSAPDRQLHDLVLNAFRHHRGRHASDVRHAARQCASCSTPFGITEVGTPSHASRSSAAQIDGAQRLSASQRSALSWHAVDRDRVAGCSTPFGITEVGTARVRQRVGATSAECSTPFGITEVGTTALHAPVVALRECAQRLSASQRSAQAMAWQDSRKLQCAQRLSASQRSAPVPRDGGDRARTCAQRLSASQRSAPGRRLTESTMPTVCSTPFGITEVGTWTARRTRRAAQGAQRLSASQRSARDVRRSTVDRYRPCSTPFGITEVGTGSARSNTDSGSRCSTPFGITEVGTVAVVDKQYARAPCAQRLSASQRSAPRC